MRSIGSVQDEAQARVFGDFLVSHGVRNQIEREGEGHWAVWIYEDDQLPAAEAWLGQFRANPAAAEFQDAGVAAARVRQAEAEELAAFRRRIHTRRSLFPKFGRYGVGVLTYALIVLCAVVFFGSKFGDDKELVRQFSTQSGVAGKLFISGPGSYGERPLAEVMSGQVWRVFTPMLIHFGTLHLLFNMVWLYQLGCMIEARRSSLELFALVLVISGASNLGQYFISNPPHPLFGGMSGVVYGLAGYAWMRGKFDRASGVHLDRQSVVILLAWLAFCYTGMVGSIANTAHVVGLLVGMVWGRVSASFARRPD